jgi:hypothetical protein
MQDEKRIEVIQRVFRGELTVGSAAVMLGIRNGSFTGLKDELRNKGQRSSSSHRGLPCKGKVKKRTVTRSRGEDPGFV